VVVALSRPRSSAPPALVFKEAAGLKPLFVVTAVGQEVVIEGTHRWVPSDKGLRVRGLSRSSTLAASGEGAFLLDCARHEDERVYVTAVRHLEKATRPDADGGFVLRIDEHGPGRLLFIEPNGAREQVPVPDVCRSGAVDVVLSGNSVAPQPPVLRYQTTF